MSYNMSLFQDVYMEIDNIIILHHLASHPTFKICHMEIKLSGELISIIYIITCVVENSTDHCTFGFHLVVFNTFIYIPVCMEEWLTINRYND